MWFRRTMIGNEKTDDVVAQYLVYSIHIYFCQRDKWIVEFIGEEYASDIEVNSKEEGLSLLNEIQFEKLLYSEVLEMKLEQIRNK